MSSESLTPGLSFEDTVEQLEMQIKQLTVSTLGCLCGDFQS